MRQALIIVGMHRSGTSLLARICNLLGADLGQGLMPPNTDNPTGFWELEQIKEIHDELFRYMGLSWDSPSRMPADWWEDPGVDRFANELEQVVRTELGDADLPCIKDPRMCRLLPIWRGIFERLHWTPRYLFVVRHPSEVVESLRKRNALPAPVMQMLWLRHVLEAEQNTREATRAVVLYDDLLNGWRAVMERAWTRLRLERSFSTDSAAIEAFVDQRLKHQHASTNETQTEELARFASRVHQAFAAAARASSDVPVDHFAELHRSFAETGRWLEPVLEAEAGRLRREIGTAATQLETAAKQIEDVNQQRLAVEREHQRLVAEAAGLRSQIDVLSQELDSQMRRGDGLQAALAEEQAAVEAIRSSTSWRLTQPLRAAKINALALARGSRAPARQLFEWVLQRLPLSDAQRFKFRQQAAAHARSLLPDANSPAGSSIVSAVAKAQRDRQSWRAARGPIVSGETGPLVSIIIPVYNKFEYTRRCLASIESSSPAHTYEIIVVDDGSEDGTQAFLSNAKGVRYVRNESNKGFLYTCMRGAEMARGEFLLFLNNDTEVKPGWLDELVETFVCVPDAGLVGSKLIYADGRLQEAGAIIWNDASGHNYGRGDDPYKPEYNYMREVDYCSAASIMVRKTLFEQVGGFDPRYMPAYYEDSDLAFAIRAAGYRVLYQPLSEAMHVEGVSCGTDISQGVKANQEANRPKFYAKWNAALKDQYSHDAGLNFAKERAGKKILIVDACTPTPDQDSGSVDAFNLMKILRSLGCKVTFVPEDNFLYFGQYTQNLQAIGVECLYSPYVSRLADHLRVHGHAYDVVILSRITTAARCIDLVKQYCRRARVIFNTVDVHYLREQRRAALEQNRQLAAIAEDTKAAELGVMRQCDCTILISEVEQALIREELPDVRTFHLPLILDVSDGSSADFASRRDIVFVGSYQHPPNVDAVLYFVRQIWPRVKHQLGDVKFHIIGGNAPSKILALADEDVIVTGHVSDLRSRMNRYRLSVAPLRYGAGLKGKVAMSMACGVPCVVSAAAAEGMRLEHRRHALIADAEEAFSAAVVEAYRDEDLWNRLSSEGRGFVNEHFSLEAGKRKVSALLHNLGVLEPKVDDRSFRPDAFRRSA